MGRPAIDEGPWLVAIVDKVWIEKALVDATNAANGKAVVDRVGRYIKKS